MELVKLQSYIMFLLRVVFVIVESVLESISSITAKHDIMRDLSRLGRK